MHILLVGANSYIGQSVARRFLEKHIHVSALARTNEIADTLEDRNIVPIRADIAEIGQATGNMERYDACIWLSFLSLDAEWEAVRSALQSIEGTGKTFIFTSGTAVLGIPAREGQWSEECFAEDEPFNAPHWLKRRVETEIYVRSAVAQNVRAIVVRPPLVWGLGGSRQIPWIFDTVRKAGAACYVGAGLNVYSHVHVDDLAELYLLAAEKGRAGALYHAVAGEINFRSIAEAVAQVTGSSARSITFEEMASLLGRSVTATAFALNSRSRCPRARLELGWNGKNVDLIEDIRRGSYATRFAEEAASDSTRC